MKSMTAFEVALKYIRNYNKDNEKVIFVDKEKIVSKQAKTLTKEDVKKVIDAINVRKHSLRNATMFFLQYYTGVRVGELSSLRYSDIQREDGTIKSEFVLTAERTKTKDARTIYLNDKVMKALKAYVAVYKANSIDDALFFTQKRAREGFSANSLTQYFNALYKRAGIEGASSHSCRRTFITELANKGVGARVLMALSGHKSMAVLQRYIDVNDDIKKKAVALL